MLRAISPRRHIVLARFEPRCSRWRPYSQLSRTSGDNEVVPNGMVSSVDHQFRFLAPIAGNSPTVLPSGSFFTITPFSALPGPIGASRSFSSRSSSKGFKLDALPFTISPEKATDSFFKWAEDDQGLKYIMNSETVQISAAYVPMWSFDINVRFQVTQSNGKKRYDWKPAAFRDAYSNSSVMHISGLSAYAGYDYRRTLVQPVHSTTLVFLSDELQPFGSWMLRDMRMESGYKLSIQPDSWNAPRGRAFGVVYGELEAIAMSDDSSGEDIEKIQVQTEVTKSRRVMLPTYVFTYSILGLEYQAFVSGCDAGAGVSGMSHQVVADDVLPTARDVSRSSQAFLSSAGRAIVPVARFLPQLLRPILPLLTVVVTRIWTKIPIVGLIGGLFAGVRKVLQPYVEQRNASAHWERQREAEAAFDAGDDYDHFQDFVDTSGNARRHFVENKERIRRTLSGEENHTEGDFDWYADWEEWARQQWTQQQQQQQSYGQQQQQAYQQGPQQQQRTQKAKKKPEYHWDFDPNDPYSVLGIQRGSTKAEVSAAFRRQMLKHHPDTQPNASEVQKERNVERSKYITEAYRKIQSDLKLQRR